MYFFRNPEIKKSLFLHIGATILFTGASLFFGISAALFSFLLCLFFTCFHLIFTFLRYRRIRRLSTLINRILHGEHTLNFSDYKEGELSILIIEIDKMLLRLQEQSDALIREKTYLADSMADISHQIRTPLTSIHLILSMLAEPDLSEEQRMTFIRQLSMLISKIDWLIESLLKISRLDAGAIVLHPEIFSVSDILTAAKKPLEIPMELRDLHFSHTAALGQESALCDFSWTVEAIGNILKNCMEHTQNGGRIEAYSSENAIFTELTIEDDGPGFSKEDLPRLFERFYKGKNSNEQSIGIGLALSRMILTRENATIKAENRPQGGARFIIRFYK